MNIEFLLIKLPVILTSIISALGVTMTFSSRSLIKKMFGLGIFQSSIIIIFLIIGYSKNSIPPVYEELSYASIGSNFSNPLPQVLMLTAIVVGLATFGVGLALVVRIKNKFNTLDSKNLEYDE